MTKIGSDHEIESIPAKGGPFNFVPLLRDFVQGHSTLLLLAENGPRPQPKDHEQASRTARCESNGGAKGIRTPDLFHAMEALYQLSYGPAPDAHTILVLVCLWRSLLHGRIGAGQAPFKTTIGAPCTRVPHARGEWFMVHPAGFEPTTLSSAS